MPPTSFTNNTFVVQVVHDPPGVMGDQIQGSGGAMVIPPAGGVATVDISGTYSANAGDIASVAYSVTMDSSVAGTVGYATTADITFQGIPNHFADSGTISPGLHLYSGLWQAPIAFPIAGSGDFSASLTLTFPSNGPDGGASGAISVSVAQLNIQLATTPASAPPLARAQNISTRIRVDQGSNVLIGGFINPGPDTKKVLIRGIGPSLSAFFTGVLEDPILQLFSGSSQLYHNDNWKIDSVTGQSQQAAVEATGLAPTNDLESVILYNFLAPGTYTAIVSGNNNGTGIGLVEVYDIDDQTVNAQLANISTRGLVETGNNVMIGGFILGPAGSLSSAVVVRAIGPSLAAVGITNALPDPILELHDGSGTLLASNDNWMDDPNHQVIMDLGLAPTDTHESALTAVSAPGNYTAIVRGVNDGTGVGLVEVYRLQ